MRIEDYLMSVTKSVALRSTCRKKVGCVLATVKGRIISTGYNGPASGVPHCDERLCRGTPCGEKGCEHSCFPGFCDSVHAEINALVQCREPESVHYVAVTLSPCMNCAKALLNTSAKILLYSSKSSHSEGLSYWTTIGLRLDKKIKEGS